MVSLSKRVVFLAIIASDTRPVKNLDTVFQQAKIDIADQLQ